MDISIPTIVFDKGASWYCYQHQPKYYVGDALNTAKILSDSDVPEIAIMNLQGNVSDSLLKIPRHITRPISLSGGISTIEQAREVIRAGYDRIGLTYPFKNAPALADQIVQELGASSLAIHIRIQAGDNIASLIEDVIKSHQASEFIVHDVNAAGTLGGLNSDIVSLLTQNTDHNFAISGGFNGGSGLKSLRVYYSTKFMFPLRKDRLDGSVNERDLASFLVRAI